MEAEETTAVTAEARLGICLPVSSRCLWSNLLLWQPRPGTQVQVKCHTGAAAHRPLISQGAWPLHLPFFWEREKAQPKPTPGGDGSRMQTSSVCKIPPLLPTWPPADRMTWGNGRCGSFKQPSEHAKQGVFFSVFPKASQNKFRLEKTLFRHRQCALSSGQT